jgi:hypothetical protein
MTAAFLYGSVVETTKQSKKLGKKQAISYAAERVGTAGTPVENGSSVGELETKTLKKETKLTLKISQVSLI